MYACDLQAFAWDQPGRLLPQGEESHWQAEVAAAGDRGQAVDVELQHARHVPSSPGGNAF